MNEKTGVGTQVPESLTKVIGLAGDSVQEGYGWKRSQWVAAAPATARPLIEDPDLVPDSIDRQTVTEFCKRVTDTTSALLAFLVTMAWGADSRDGRVAARVANGLRSEGSTTTVMKLTEASKAGQPNHAYKVARDNRIHGVGPAFATKFMFFCSLAEYPQGPDEHVALIHDRVLTSWLWEEAAVDVHADDWAPRSYTRYLDTMWTWARETGIPAHRLEELIFRLSAGDLNERDKWSKPDQRAHHAVRHAWAALKHADGPANEIEQLERLARRIEERAHRSG